MKKQSEKPHKQYDLIVIPALKLGPHWGLRYDLRDRLKKATVVYKDNPGAHIAVCGRWSIWYDWLGIKPPVTECARMKDYLVKNGVNAKDIVMESHSKDTPGNAYYLKCYVRTRQQYKKLLVICAAQHEERLRFLFYKFFGNKYLIDYLPVKAPRFSKNVTGSEAKCLKEQKALLANVRPGHEKDFAHELYNGSYYKRQAKSALPAGLIVK
jgi:uncharacterized SAM-binding protein YcdF (DUF218 family)